MATATVPTNTEKYVKPPDSIEATAELEAHTLTMAKGSVVLPVNMQDYLERSCAHSLPNEQ